MDLAPPIAAGFMEPLLILPYIFLTSIHFEEKLKLFRAKKKLILIIILDLPLAA